MNCITAPEAERKHVAAPPAEESKAENNEAGDFNWMDDDSIVLHEQAAISVYRNQNGGLVIRQERRWDEEDDTIIVISPENIMPFIDKLTDVAGIPSVGGPR